MYCISGIMLRLDRRNDAIFTRMVPWGGFMGKNQILSFDLEVDIEII